MSYSVGICFGYMKRIPGVKKIGIVLICCLVLYTLAQLIFEGIGVADLVLFPIYPVRRDPFSFAKSCLGLEGTVFRSNTVEDIDKHFKDLKHVKNIPEYDPGKPFTLWKYKGLRSGNWIENYWIERFDEKNINFFNGVVPILYPFQDMIVRSRWGKGEQHTQVGKVFSKLLTKELIYFAVTQGQASYHDSPIIVDVPENVLVLSGGGYGDIPLPLILAEWEYKDIGLSEYEYDISFLGRFKNIRPDLVSIVNETLRNEFPNSKFYAGLHDDWKNMMYKTKVSLAPRGVGRSSFRFSEIVQMGGIPYLVWEEGDIPWIPYKDSEAGLADAMFYSSSNPEEVTKIVRRIMSMTDGEFTRRKEIVKKYRNHYTYDGVLEQIYNFFSRKEHDLSCVPRPKGPGYDNIRKGGKAIPYEKEAPGERLNEYLPEKTEYFDTREIED